MKYKTQFSMGYYEASKVSSVMAEAGFVRSEGGRGTVHFTKPGKLTGEKRTELLAKMAEAAFQPETLPLDGE
jgi:hypothetical protein